MFKYRNIRLLSIGSNVLKTAEKTKKENHEQKLENLQAEVEALKEQLRRSQRLATVGTMTAMVAHEFNNILTPIINYAQLARSNPDLIEKAISRAADGGQRATNICNAILNMTRNAPTEPVEINIKELISDTISAMARDPKSDAIELTIDSPDDLVITTRRVELQQVLLNLLINARAAVLAKNGPRSINISATKTKGSIEVCISDNGIGIGPENLKKIFQPFFTTKASETGDSKGSGLGLAVCKEILTALRGDIDVESKPDQGTTFIINLPAEWPE